MASRGSFVTLNTGPSISLNEASSACNCSASVTIVRNLSIVKGRAFSPLRCCRNSTGPG